MIFLNKILSLKNKSLKYGLNAVSFLYDFSKNINVVEKKDYDVFLPLDKEVFFDNNVEEYFFYKNDFLKHKIVSEENFIVEKDKNYFFEVESDSTFILDLKNVVNNNSSSNFFIFIIKKNVNFNLKNVYFKDENLKEKNDDDFKSFIFKFFLEENSIFNFNQLFVSNEKVFLRNKFFLEENSVVNPYHSIFTFEKSFFDFYSNVFHLNKNSNSDMKVKSVNINNSKSILQGNIRIFPEAFYSNGYQQIDNIILDSSIVIPIPNLEIHNNEVKCSHGSTTTTIDKELLFYLQSRGINKKESILLLLSNFLNSNLNLFKESEKEYYTNKIKELIVLEEKL